MNSPIHTISNVEVSYGRVRDDRSLPEDFHEQGRQVVHLHQFLRTMKTKLGTRSLSEDDISTTKELNRSAKLLRGFFQGVAEARPGSRSAYYEQAQGNVGNGLSARVVLIQMMNVACALAENAVIRSAMEHDINRLRRAMEKLEVAGSDGCTNYFSGQGQNNLVGDGTQNNANGSGNLFPGATFHGDLTFGSEY